MEDMMTTLAVVGGLGALLFVCMNIWLVGAPAQNGQSVRLERMNMRSR